MPIQQRLPIIRWTIAVTTGIVGLGMRGGAVTKGMLTLIAGVFLLGLPACDVLDTETPGALVPPTADQDPSLPQILVDVAGHTRALHLRTFGDPERPVLLVLPGGPGTDFRLLLPLQELSDRYYGILAGRACRSAFEKMSLP